MYRQNFRVWQNRKVGLRHPCLLRTTKWKGENKKKYNYYTRQDSKEWYLIWYFCISIKHVISWVGFAKKNVWKDTWFMNINSNFKTHQTACLMCKNFNQMVGCSKLSRMDKWIFMCCIFFIPIKGNVHKGCPIFCHFLRYLTTLVPFCSIFSYIPKIGHPLEKHAYPMMSPWI